MISVHVVTLILLVHYMADFWSQTRWQADNKCRSFDALSMHVSAYTFFLAIGYLLLSIGPKTELGVVWILLNGGLHLVVDFFTSKFTSKFFKDNDYGSGFKVVGFDQLLHTVILVATYDWIFNG